MARTAVMAIAHQLELILVWKHQKTQDTSPSFPQWRTNMLKKTLVALCATTALLSAGAALADKPGAGWITIEKAIETAKTKAGYVEVYKAEADDNGYWEVKGRKSDGIVYEARIDGASGNVLRDQKD
jgi:uncharacterized membrane protein YkoI